ncbi:MAG: acyl-CoA thioesterase [Planctomycetes bacterium]|nr:acyl-CoA thioesterase [Planctomycetota bacterium]
MLPDFEMTLRVRYQETDAQGRVHHANYLSYFEQGRVEQLRAAGRSYKALEQDGIRLVVAEATCRYHWPAEFDDELRLVTRVTHARGARIVHEYRLFRGDELMAEGTTTVACVDASGRATRLPEWLRQR